MDYNWSPLDKDSSKAVTVLLHQTATPLDVLTGVAPAAFDLTAFVTRGSQSADETQVTLKWHLELYGEAQPTPGQVLEVQMNGKRLWLGIIASISDYSLASGEKHLTVVARSRDGAPAWRDVRRVTPLYPIGTSLRVIATEVAKAVGLSDAEISFDDVAGYTPHSATQLADLTAWQMLEALLQTNSLAPMVDRYGVLRTVSRDTSRPSNVLLGNEQLERVSGSKSRTPITKVMVKWLDPSLSEVSQQGRKLANATITAGFFQRKQVQSVTFSDDGTQRARSTYLVIKQSCNSGLLDVADETYAQTSQYGGVITLKTHSWVPGLATVAIAAIVVSGFIGDAVVALGAGITVPIGRIIHVIAEAVLLVVMMSIGTGVYEIWGTPYDYVHARNRTCAYNSAAQPWEENIKEIENDFLAGELAAQGLATTELLYEHRSASSYNVTIVDDPRIEIGDIVELADGSRLYVVGYNRDITPLSPAMLNLEGFRV